MLIRNSDIDQNFGVLLKMGSGIAKRLQRQLDKNAETFMALGLVQAEFGAEIIAAAERGELPDATLEKLIVLIDKASKILDGV